MKRLELYIARRYLAARPKGRFLSMITLISIGGIFLGVTALITVIAVMTGLQQDLQEKILGSNPHVYVFEQGPSFRMGDWRPVLDSVREVPGVVAAEPFVMTTVGIIRSGNFDYAQTGMLYGIDPVSDTQALTDIQAQIQSGELSFGPTASGKPGILIGEGLAGRLGVYPGDIVTIGALENMKTHPTVGQPFPKLAQFEVAERFETGMHEYDTKYMYVPMSAAQELLDLEGGVSGIAVNAADPWQAGELSVSVSDALGSRYWTRSWMDLNSSLFSALKLEKLAMGVILFLIVLVAAFNIVSTLIMVVTDKTREIGILKSMGLTDRRVLRIFTLQGLTIGVIGTALGAAGGLGLVWLLDRYQFITLPGEVYFIDRLPVALDPLDLGVILAVSILISFAATIYPARQASRLTPVEAIRHE